jgi:hypothetical protein
MTIGGKVTHIIGYALSSVLSELRRKSAVKIFGSNLMAAVIFLGLPLLLAVLSGYAWLFKNRAR